MKKILLILLAIAVCNVVANAFVKGDVNGDGNVTSADVTALYNYLLNGDTNSMVNGDVNSDGNITSADVTYVYNILLGNVQPEEPPAPVTEYTVNGVTFKMVDIEGGTFTMGATTEQGSDAYNNESPTHQVTLSSFAIGQTEVTQELWQAVMGNNPSWFNGIQEGEWMDYDFGTNLQRPVENVTWNECQQFVAKLNQMLPVEGYEFRLPTEAEWEFAARGGNKSQGYKYAGSNTINDVAWYSSNSSYETNTVATKAPNELGLYDMSGNISEWCYDRYSIYSSDAQTNPTGPSSGYDRVCRGGCWDSTPKNCRVSFRGYGDASLQDPDHYVGLRIALAPKTFTVNGYLFKMVPVEGGTFNMGATSEQGSNLSSDEYPVHQVTLSSFSIGETEVTQGLWEAVMGSNPCVGEVLQSCIGPDMPVVGVSWDECQIFLAQLKQLTGMNFRLPTEAEWEYAARGGNKSKGYKYAGSNTVGDVAWYNGNVPDPSATYCIMQVAQKLPNELGIYDMSGNVDEWCQDWYNSSYYSVSPSNDPTGPETGYYRVCRGGSWLGYSSDCKIANRDNWTPSSSTRGGGLRLALSPEETITVNGVSFKMIKVDGGTFTMGAADDDSQAYDLERPAHQVTLSDYWIGETEVTEALWKAVMEVDAVPFSMGDNYPVRRYGNGDCVEFAERLSQLTGRNFTLPTEAQWEFAARGGNKSHGYLYAGSNNIDEVAWYDGNSGDELHEVATKAPNELGIYDMCGNLAEWVSDGVYYYTADPQVNPTHPVTDNNNACRSSCWIDDARDTRLTTRWLTGGSSIWIGFRIVMQ